MPERTVGPLGWLAAAMVVALALLAVFGVLDLASYGGYYGMMGTGSWAWAAVMMAVPAGVLILVLVAAIRGLGAPPSADPLALLDARYARGELSREQYLTIRGDLAKRSGGA